MAAPISTNIIHKRMMGIEESPYGVYFHCVKTDHLGYISECVGDLQNGMAGHIEGNSHRWGKINEFRPEAPPLWSIFVLGPCRLHLGSVTGMPVSHPVLSFTGLADERKPGIEGDADSRRGRPLGRQIDT